MVAAWIRSALLGRQDHGKTALLTDTLLPTTSTTTTSTTWQQTSIQLVDQMGTPIKGRRTE